MNNEDLRIQEYNMDEIEQYQELINDFKIRMMAEAGLVPEDAKTLMREAKEDIISLRTGIDDIKTETLQIKEDCREMAAMLYKLETLDKIKNVKVKINVQDFFELYENDKLFTVKNNIDMVVKLFKEMNINE